jgi:PilZ domain
VACGESNGGMVLNVSDEGMAISMAIPVGDEAYSNLHVRMNGLGQSIEVNGRMAWTTKSKKRAGIQLVDISEEQRGRMHEWLAHEGARDVNLLPRVSEPVTSSLPAFAGAAISPALLDKPRPDLSSIAASAPINAPVLAEPHVSLLAGLGGTPPEFLAPPPDETKQQEDPPRNEDIIAETQSYQGSNPSFAGFRENEWDLASVTMVPRKRSKPAGLSALGLLLLWIAIPSFGIGILVGRRPLQQWLSNTMTARKNISHGRTPDLEVASTRGESPDITGSDIDATGPQSLPGRTVETPTTAISQDVKTPAATKSFVSTPAFVDTGLLNSMSTQEVRAIKSPVSTTASEYPNANEPSKNEPSKVNSKADAGAVDKDAFLSQSPAVKAVIRTDSPVTPPGAHTNAGNASPQGADSRDKSTVAPAWRETPKVAVNKDPIAPGYSKQNPSDQAAKTISVDPGSNAAAYSHPNNVASNGSASNAAAPRSTASNVSPISVTRSASSSNPTVSNTPASTSPITHQNTTGQTSGTLAVGNASTASSQSVNHSINAVSGTAGNSTVTSSSVSDASRNNNTVLTASKTQPAPPSPVITGAATRPDVPSRMAPNVRPNMASNAYAPNSSRPAGTGPTTNLAPVNAQPPLHGVMLVARKNNESFLLRLPVESVANGRSISIEMQRFVMMPAESRWHHHGPIAKLTVGELLTQVAPNQVEMASYARPGDAVTVRVFVDKNGSVEDLKPVSGRVALMPRVMHDVRDWQFDQTLIDGKPVESEINITVEFRSAPGPQLNRSGREIQAQNSFKP